MGNCLPNRTEFCPFQETPRTSERPPHREHHRPETLLWYTELSHVMHGNVNKISGSLQNVSGTSKKRPVLICQEFGNILSDNRDRSNFRRDFGEVYEKMVAWVSSASLVAGGVNS